MLTIALILLSGLIPEYNDKSKRDHAKPQLPGEISIVNAATVEPLTKYLTVQNMEPCVSNVMATSISRHSANQRMYMRSRHMKEKDMPESGNEFFLHSVVKHLTVEWLQQESYTAWYAHVKVCNSCIKMNIDTGAGRQTLYN